MGAAVLTPPLPPVSPREDRGHSGTGSRESAQLTGEAAEGPGLALAWVHLP